MMSLTREFQKIKYKLPQPGVPVALHSGMGILFGGLRSLRLTKILKIQKLRILNGSPMQIC